MTQPLCHGEVLQVELAADQAIVASVETPVAETSVRVRHSNEVHAHRLSVASTLAVDVLCEIIDRWVDIEHGAPLTAMLVSRRWNEALGSYAAAWRNIWIRPTKIHESGNRDDEEKVAYGLRKAGGSALNVRVDLYTSRPVQRFMAFDPLNDSQKTSLQRQFAKACKATSNWKELSIYHLYHHQMAGTYAELPKLQELGSSIANAVGCGSLPHLKKLTVVSQPGFDSKFSFDNPISDGRWLLPHLPNVQHVVYLGLRVPCSTNLNCNALCSLTIGRCVYDTVADIITLMNCTPALESLTIVDLAFEKRPSDGCVSPVVHPSLRELNIGDFDYFCVAEGSCARALFGGMSLTLPRLEQLRVCYQNHDSIYQKPFFQQPRDPVPLLDFLARSLPPIHELQLVTSFNLDDGQLREILRLTPLLASLQVLVSADTDTLRKLLVSPESAGDVLCPKLERLVVLGCDVQHMDVIWELAYNRRQVDAGLGPGNLLVADGKPMRTFRFLHVYGSRDVAGSADSIAELLPAGSFLCSQLEGGGGHLAYSEKSMPVPPTEENSAKHLVEAVLNADDTNSLQLDTIAPPSLLAGNLPIDIIHEILERWVAIDQNVSWTALRICRRWSQAVTCYSPIWRRICLNPVGLSVEDCRSRVAENVRYASNSPLEIHIRWYGNLGLRSKRLKDKEHLYDKAMRAGIVEARRASSTWKSLSIHVCSTRQIDELLDAFRPRRRATAQGLAGLQSLRIVADEESPFYEMMGWANMPKAWFLEETPNLRSFVCLGFRFRSAGDEKLPSFFSSLRSLTLGRCSFVRVTELRNVMESCAVLEELTFVDVCWSMDLSDPDQDTTLIHSSLRQLRIFCASRLEPSTLVAMNEMRLTFPNLQRLQVCRPVTRKVEHCRCGKGENEAEQREGDEDGTALLKFVERSSSSLVDLHVAGLIMRDSQLQQLLRLVPHLQKLTASFSASLLLRFAGTKTGVMLCPMLQNLTVVGCHEEHVASLRVVAKSRIGAEVSRRKRDTSREVLRSLRVHGCPKMREHVEDIGEMVEKGVIAYSDEDEGTYSLPA